LHNLFNNQKGLGLLGSGSRSGESGSGLREATSFGYVSALASAVLALALGLAFGFAGDSSVAGSTAYGSASTTEITRSRRSEYHSLGSASQSGPSSGSALSTTFDASTTAPAFG
jgi:hypothetical protein